MQMSYLVHLTIVVSVQHQMITVKHLLECIPFTQLHSPDGVLKKVTTSSERKHSWETVGKLRLS